MDEFLFVLPSLYFGSLGVASAVVLTNWATVCFKRQQKDKLCGSRLPLILALPFSVVALYVTWSLIFEFFGNYLTRFGCDDSRLSLFICDTPAWRAAPSGDTFVEAYVQVTNRSGGWVWSSTLLTLVVPACVWLHTQGTRFGLSRRHQASFLVLGFFGAISVAFPLAFAHMHALQHPHRKDGKRGDEANVGVVLVLTAAIAYMSALMLPLTVHYARGVYIIALALLHVILFVPTAVNSTGPVNGLMGNIKNSLNLGKFYSVLAGGAAMQHAFNLVQHLITQTTWKDGLAELMWQGWANECQRSISWDVCLTTFACAGYMTASSWAYDRPLTTFWLVVAIPLISPAASFAIFLAEVEMDRAMRLLSNGHSKAS